MVRARGFVYKRNGTYYVAYSDPTAKGGYARESTGSDKKRYADKMLEQKLEILRARENGWESTNAPYIDHFKSFLGLYRQGSETLKSYSGVLKLFSEFLQDKYPQVQFLHEFCVNPKIFDDYRSWLKAERMTPEGNPHKDWTVKNHLKVIKTAFLQAEKWRHIIRAPDINCAVSILDRKQIVELSKEEDFKLFFDRCKKLKPEYFPHYFVSATCGLRFGEMVSLTWEDIDFDKGYLRIRQNKDFIPKGRNKRTGLPKERSIPLTGDVIKILKSTEHSKVYPNVFLKDGQPISKKDKSFRRWIIAFVRGTPLDGMTRFHELRHTTGHILGNAGVDKNVIKDILGHSDIRTTERYVGIPQGPIKKAMRKLQGFGAKKKG